MTACPTVSPHRPGWPATAAPVALAVFWLVRTEGVVSGLNTSRTGLA